MRPVMREEGDADWEKYVIGYDAAAVVAHPDAGKDAKDLHDRIVISDQALRERTNFIDEDAPTDEEWHRRAALKMNNAAALGYVEEIPVTADVNEDAQVTG